MTMQLEEMKHAWSQLKIERILDDVRRPRSAWLGLAGWFGFVVVAGSAWIDHRDNPHLLIAGLVLHAYGIAAIVTGTRLLLARSQLDYMAPIVTLQRQLAGLRRQAARRSLALGLPWWFLWVPCLLVAAGVAGFDLYAAATAWVWSSLAVGAVGLAVSVWLARRCADRAIRSPTLRTLVDHLGGGRLARAARELDELARFTADDDDPT
jgi:hypothetical protein